MPKFRRWLARPAIIAMSALAVLGVGTTLAATSASASPVVTATTSVTNHPDTTNASGPGCTSSPGGPVWALDSYTSTMTATETGTNVWTVAIADTGTFAGFADPATCAYGVSHGSFTMNYTVTVTSPTAPVAADLKASYDGAISTSTMVGDFFNGAATNIAGGDYYASYQGGNYVQSTSGVSGDVKLDACTVTIKPIADQSSVLGDTVSVQVVATSNEPHQHFLYDEAGLPKSVHLNPVTGLINGTLTGPTGTSQVSIKVYNTDFQNPDAGVFCDSTITFKWTVSLTKPSPAPTPSSSSTPGSGTVPVGGVQTGYVEAGTTDWLPFAYALVALGAIGLAGGGAVALRKRHSHAGR